MKSFGSIPGKLLLAALSVVCMAVSISFAAEAATIGSAPKPVSHASTHAVPSAIHRPEVKTSVRHTTARRPVYHHPSTTRRAATGHSTQRPAEKPVTRSSSSYAARHTTHHPAYSSHRTVSAAHRRSSRPLPVSALNGYQRLARLHLQPERVQEIQQALIRDGYLQGDASGQWDTRTHEAMLHFQTDHGFPATGLPEAKSLMKLGLGSHPLPAELDRGSASAPAAGGAQGDLTSPPSSPPVSQATPPS